MISLQLVQAGGTAAVALFVLFTIGFALSWVSGRISPWLGGAAFLTGVLAAGALTYGSHEAQTYQAAVAEHLHSAYGATVTADALRQLPATDVLGRESVLLTVAGVRHMCVIDTRGGAAKATALCTQSDLPRAH